jgi:transglutaminase-like putative cysteine protease
LGSEARARLGLAGLLAVTLLSLSQLFDAGDYPGPILLGVLLAAALAMAARRLGVGTLLTIVLSVAALVLYLSVVFESRHTLYGLPTPTSLGQLVDAVRHALDNAQLDFAPVPVRAGYVIMFVTGMWLATTIGEIATFRWKRPLIASTPTLLLFSVIVIVGTGRAAGFMVVLFLAALLTYWGLEAAHRLRSWGRWIPTWSGSAEEEPVSVTGAIARRMGAMALVAAVAAPLFLPALGDGLLAWRTGLGVGGPGGGPGGRIDPFVSIRPRLLNQTGSELFSVEPDSPTYWRLVTLAEFDGSTWTQVGDADEPAAGGLVPAAVPLDHTEEIDQEFRIENLEGDFLPAAAQATAVTFTGDDDRVDDLRFDTSTGDIRLDGDDLTNGLSYDVSSSIPSVSYRQLRNAEPGESLNGMYTDSPDGGLSAEVIAWRDETIGEAETPYEQLVAIQDRLRDITEFTYSTGNPAAGTATTDYVTEFLINSKQGFCQQFATAFALLSRSLGYPTRMVVGFLPGEESSEGRRIVRGTDAHAWPEVYFEEFGWIAFDPTPRAEVDSNRFASAPPYTVPSNPPGSENAGRNVSLPQQLGVDPRTLSNRLQGEVGATGGGGDAIRAPQPPRRPRGTPQWAKTFSRIALGVGVLFVLFLVTVPAIKEYRVRRRYARARGTRSLAEAAFLEFETNAAELAAPRRMSESARIYARRVSELKGLPDRPMMRLAAIYEAAEYAQNDIPASDAEEARRLAHELRARLWRNSSWWQRLVRLFSPTSLQAPRSVARPAFSALPFTRTT